MASLISNVHSGLAGTPARLVASLLAMMMVDHANVPPWLKDIILLLASTQ